MPDRKPASRKPLKSSKALSLVYSNTPYGRKPLIVNQKIQNASVIGNSGAMGWGDRGSNNTLPLFTDNPLTFTNFLQKYRTYVMLYRTSWEARKIIRIPVDDALRKPWIAEGIPQNMAAAIQTKLDNLQFLSMLKRSLLLERLLGGALTFMGVESNVDDVSKPYHPKEGARLRFINAIPVSRISRVDWSTDPLSPQYMRPQRYLINGEFVDISRTLVFDGSPMFDSADFMLTPYYSNMSGFGDSVLASVWDDIIKAVGTRQAAYQLIQINSAIIAAVSDLQDLAGTTSGKTKLQKIREIANTLSVYRAALVDGDKVQITQHSASFGSVPELLMAFLQVLSAGSDIPATRFLGNAPGGLSTDDRSGLENYYNSEDAYQHQRIEPQVKRAYDFVGYNLFPNEWEKARKDLRLNFPPLWNLTEIEEADRRTKLLDNILKAVNDRVMTEEHAIEEINASKIFTTKLDATDLSVLEEAGEQEMQQQMMGAGTEEMNGGANGGMDAHQEIGKLANKGRFWNGAEFERPLNHTSFTDMIHAAEVLYGFKVDLDQFDQGILIEQEHDATAQGDEKVMARITLDHLREIPDYYDRLERMEAEANDGQGKFENADDDHWITIKKGEEGKGRHILIDKNGKIIGGSLPKSAQGKHIGSWWREEKKPEPVLHQHLQSVGVPYAHHESGELTTGHGKQYGKNKWDKDEIKPGHVGVVKSKHTDEYLALESNFSDKDMIKAMGAKFGPQLGAQYPKQWYLPHGKLARLIKSMEHSRVSPEAVQAYSDWAEKNPDKVEKIKEIVGAIPLKTKPSEAAQEKKVEEPKKTQTEAPKQEKTWEERQKEQRAVYEEKVKAGTAGLSKGSGYGGYGAGGWAPGDVVRAPQRIIEKGSPEYLYVTKASKKYYAEDGMSFGVGDESGYVYSAETRPATEEEAAPVIAREKEKAEAKEKAQKLLTFARDFSKDAEYPEGHDNIPEGETVPIGKGQNIYGGGEWFVIGPEYIWYVRNNGSDGDDWSRNNVQTGGAGAIGFRKPYSKELEDEILSLTGYDMEGEKTKREAESSKKKADEEAFEKDWTKEKTIERRNAWNTKMTELKKARKPMYPGDIAKYEKEFGFSMDELRKAVRLHKLDVWKNQFFNSAIDSIRIDDEN